MTKRKNLALVTGVILFILCVPFGVRAETLCSVDVRGTVNFSGVNFKLTVGSTDGEEIPIKIYIPEQDNSSIFDIYEIFLFDENNVILEDLSSLEEFTTDFYSNSDGTLIIESGETVHLRVFANVGEELDPMIKISELGTIDTIVPEPGTLMLLGTSSLLLICHRAYRRKKIVKEF